VKASLKRWVGRTPDLSAVISRFPVAVALMAIFTVIIIVFDNFGNNEPLARMLAGLIIGAYLSFCVTIAREAKGQSPAYLLQIALAVVIAAIAWFSKELRFNLPMAIGAVLLILGNMVIWRKSRDDLHVWDFTHKIWTGAVFATVGSIIFTLGVFAISAALKSLFGLNMNRLIENLILPLGLGFLAPLYWLSTAPRVDESFQELHDNPGFVSKAVAFMGTWLLSPLTLIYALILLAYGLKIILAGSLPKGEIAQLTTPFLLVGTLTWLVLEPPFIQNKALAKLFRKLWFPLSIPAALMLGISVGVRIGEYGFTPERIALFMAVIWALGLGLWFTVGPKAKRDIRLVPGFAALLLAIGAFGAEALSISNQKSRAVTGMKQAGIMSDAGIVLSPTDISIKDEAAAVKAKGSLTYLIHNNETKVLRKMFEGAESIPEFKKYDSADLFNRLALEDIQTATKAYDNPAITFDLKDKTINVQGYDTLYGPLTYYSSENSGKRVVQDANGFKIEGENSRLTFSQDDITLGEFDITPWLNALPISNNRYQIEDNRLYIFSEGVREIVLQVTTINHWRSGPDEKEAANATLGFMVLRKGF